MPSERSPSITKSLACEGNSLYVGNIFNPPVSRNQVASHKARCVGKINLSDVNIPLKIGSVTAIFVRPWKMVSVSVCYLFYRQMDEKIKTWSLRFRQKENANMEKAFFHWPIVLQHDVKAKYRLISRKFSGMKVFHPRFCLTNQKPRAFVSVR